MKFRFNMSASDYWFATKPAVECFRCGVCRTEECFNYSHFLEIQSETTSCFKAPLRDRPKQNNTGGNIKIVNYRLLSRLIFLNLTSEWIGRVFFYNTILDIAQPRGCLSVVRGTWNRPCPMSSVVFLHSPGFSMLLEKKWGLYLDPSGLWINIQAIK